MRLSYCWEQSQKSAPRGSPPIRRLRVNFSLSLTQTDVWVDPRLQTCIHFLRTRQPLPNLHVWSSSVPDVPRGRGVSVSNVLLWKHTTWTVWPWGLFGGTVTVPGKKHKQLFFYLFTKKEPCKRTEHFTFMIVHKKDETFGFFFFFWWMFQLSSKIATKCKK